MENILKNICTNRKEKGFSHEVVAHLLNIAPATYYKIESGKTELTVKRLFQIANAIETSVSKLLDIDAKNYVNSVNDNATVIQNIERQYQTEKNAAYENHIESLKAEIAFLKSMIDRMNGKN
jgi:transcriptional regulator with XRE-family HTH domain